MRERDFHRSVADFLAVVLPKDAIWTTIAPEGAGEIRGAQNRRKGVRVGWPDVQILSRGMFIGIELKSATGKPTLEQIQVGLAIEKAGGKWFIARSLEDLTRKLAACGVPLRASTGALASVADAARKVA